MRKEAMGHEIRKGDRFAEVRANGQRAWHGLGVEIPEGLNAVAAFQRVGIDWETELAPVYARFGDDLERSVALDGHFAHIRKDTGDVLGLVSSDYKPFENKDLARLADALVDADHEVLVETCGTLYGGRRVFVLVKLPRDVRVTDEDILEQFICVSNGHGGTAVLSAYPTKVRIVCANTLRASETSLVRGGSWRHVGDFDQKVAQARAVLGLAARETEQFEAQVKMLVKTNMSKAKVREYMERVYDRSFKKIDEEGDAATVEKLKERRNKTLEQWEANLEDARQSLTGIRGTAWAAYNAISQWQDHERGRFATVHDSDARVHSNLFGTAHKGKLVAYREALTLAR